MANRKVQRMNFLGLRKGKLYKKAYPQYDVNDYVLYLPKEWAHCPFCSLRTAYAAGFFHGVDKDCIFLGNPPGN